MESNRGLLAILPRGEAIRNMVYTGALQQVASESEAPLAVLAVKPNEAIWNGLSARFDALHELTPRPEPWLVRALREELDLAHGRWLWSKGAQARWEWREREAVSPRQRMKRALKKLVAHPFINRPGLGLLTMAEGWVSRRHAGDDCYLALLRQLKPSLVFNASHVHSNVALPVIHAAQRLGIPTATFIFSWDNLTSQGRIYPPPDYYLVWNESLRRDLLAIYHQIDPARVLVTGTPQFDFHFRSEFAWSREEYCARIGADPARPLVLYSTGMANHIAGEPALIAQTADLLRGMTDLGSPQLVVRILPKGPQEVFDQIRATRPDILFPTVDWEQNWLTPTIDDAFLLSNTLRHAAVGINIASTISLELCMFDKPTINIGFLPPGLDPAQDFDFTRYYDFEHYRPIISSGAVQLARTPEELASMIRRAILSPADHRREREGLLKSFFGHTLDGRSSERLAAQLIDLTRETDQIMKRRQTR